MSADRSLLLAQAVVIALVNLVPLYGALALGWSQAGILLIYWAETVIIGFYTVLKMAFSFGPVGPLRPDTRRALDPEYYKVIGVRETLQGIDTFAMFKAHPCCSSSS